MKRLFLVSLLGITLTACVPDPHGPDVAGSVAFGPEGIYGGTVSVGSGVYAPGYYPTPLVVPTLLPPPPPKPHHPAPQVPPPGYRAPHPGGPGPSPMPGRSPHAAPAPRPNGPHMAAPGRPQHQPSMNNHPGGPSENARPAMNRAPQGGGSRPIEARRNEQGRPFPQQGEPGGHRR